MRATYKKNRREVSITPIQVYPGDIGPCNLPYAGRTQHDYLTLILDGADESVFHRRNLTKSVITVYHCHYADTGEEAGYLWERHLIFPKENPCVSL